MNQKEFEKLVQEAVLELPENFRQKMVNVAVVVEKFPSQNQLKKSGTRKNSFLLGLYQGVPQTVWGQGFGNHLPDKITIFQDSIERFAKTPDAVKEMVQDVIWHEVAHYFGLDEKRVRQLEKKRKTK